MFLLKEFIQKLLINKGWELGWSLQEEQTEANFVKLTAFGYICRVRVSSMALTGPDVILFRLSVNQQQPIM